MKVAFFVNKFPSLSETFILNQITGLLDRGHDVHIYASRPGNDRIVHADVERYGLLDRTFYYREALRRTMPSNGLLRLLKAVVLLAGSLGKRPMPLVRSLDVLKFGKQAASLHVFYKVLVFCNQGSYEYDIVHCHFGPKGNLAALLKRVGAIKGKVITTFHGYDVSSYVKARGPRVYDSLFETGDLFLPISERWKEALISLGCSRHKIVVHRMGIDTDSFSFSPRKPQDDGRIHLLTVARLVEKKGVQYGIRAAAKLIEAYPQIEYKIAGDGRLRGDVERLIDGLNVEGKVRLLGWKRQGEIIALMKEADIILAPSVTSEDGDQEGIPVVLMEALAQGLPVLSTQHSGIPELVQDGESGFLVPERDIDALAEKLEHLVRHPEIWPEMGGAGRDFVEKYYDINKLNDRLVELYQQLLEGRDCVDMVA